MAISYEDTKVNDTGPVPGRTWPYYVFGLVFALGLGTGIALYTNRDALTEFESWAAGKGLDTSGL